MSVAVTMFISILVLSLPFGSADEPPPIPPPQSIEEKILGAKTSTDHEAIATYYDKEAQDAHAKHAKHQKMEEYYQKNPALNKSGFSTHCDIIASNYDKTAKEYEALAKLHRDMAKSTK
jgi:hypothetical protein